MTQIHATTIAIDEQGVLLCGPSGSGKSDLALRLIEQGARLISDDRTELIKKGADVIAFAPSNIAGLIEVRGLGIMRLQHLEAAPVRLVIHLSKSEELARLPEDDHIELEGVKIPQMSFNAFHASTAAKISLALAYHLGHIERIE